MKLMEFVINMAVNGDSAAKDLKKVANQADNAGAKMAALESRAHLAGQRIGDAMKGMASQLKAIGAASFALASAAGGGMLKTAASFEDMEATLETIEGSSEKAKESLAWVKEFATKTPYELKDVTEAFVKLKAYGMNGMDNGLMATLGDTAAAMGKDVISAVEAIADAVTGENERLKEFGIKAASGGGKTSYSYTDKLGKQQTKTVDANNRAQIQSTLQAIWNEKYGGAMERRSKTFTGMLSNMKDAMTNFSNDVMQSGAFEEIKKVMASLLASIGDLANDGTLKKWADEVGAAMKEFFVALTGGSGGRSPKETLEGIKNALVGIVGFSTGIANFVVKVKDLVGGWDNLTYALIGVKTLAASGLLSPLMSAIPMLMSAVGGLASFVISSFLRMGAVMLANPIGLVVAAIVAGAYLVWRNWDKIIGFLKNAWLGAKLFLSGIADGIMAIWANIANYVIDKVNTVVSAINMVSGANIGTFDRVGGAAPSTANPATSATGGNTFTNNVTVNANTRAAVDRAVEPSFGRQTRSAGLSGVMA